MKKRIRKKTLAVPRVTAAQWRAVEALATYVDALPPAVRPLLKDQPDVARLNLLRNAR